jgi:hypothetical protein
MPKRAYHLYLQKHRLPHTPKYPAEFWRIELFNKIRRIVKRTLKHFKINMCVAERRTRKHATMEEYVFLAKSAGQLTMIVAHQMSYPHLK